MDRMMLGSPLCVVKERVALFIKELNRLIKSAGFTGGDNRDRTGNPQLAKLVLSQLSYIPKSLVGPSGIEPETSALSARRSSQLSYRP